MRTPITEVAQNPRFHVVRSGGVGRTAPRPRRARRRIQALPIAITVPGPETPKLVIGATSYQLGAATQSVQVKLANSGNVHLSLAGSCVLSRAGGAETLRQDVKLSSIFAGTSTLLQVNLPQPLDPGNYVVSLKLADESHDLSVHADALPLEVKAVDATGSPVAASPKIAITSVGVNELRDSSTKKLQCA